MSDVCNIKQVGGRTNDRMMVDLQLDGKTTQLELDTGAAVSTIFINTFKKLRPNKKLEPIIYNIYNNIIIIIFIITKLMY